MNIVPTQIRGFNLQFTEAELAGLIDDLPRESKYRGPLIAARNGAFDDETAGAEESKRKVRAGSKYRNYPKATRAESDSLLKVNCEHCGKPIAKKYMANHLRKKHPGQASS